MSERYEFDEREKFLEKLREMIKRGVNPKKIEVYTPYPVQEVGEILQERPSSVRIFTLLGALSGTITGFGFTTFTVKHWELIVGGKPLVSIPAFVIIAFELTILFGALATMLGFLIIAGLPRIKRIFEPVDFGNKFVILVKE